MSRIAALLVLVLSCFASPAFAGIGAPDTVVVIVRHAEKATDDPRDPTLSETGQARADALASALKGLPIAAAYATQYKRTQLTATPAAHARGIEVTVRPVDKANETTYATDLAHDIRRAPPGRNVLIVGHSNTVPEMVKALTGIDAAPMGDDEFDRIYVVTLPVDGPARFVVLKY
ncbi:MAG: SixA phosphatase family protein [Arenimonas sp.]